jgi:hypothetical protein
MQPVQAVRFYEAAFAADERLAVYFPRYYAARCAALAAAGQGNDADKLGDAEKTQLRGKAIAWLQRGVAELRQQLQTNPKSSGDVLTKLNRYEQDAELARLRDARELATLADAERQAWQQLWAEVAQLRRQVLGGR